MVAIRESKVVSFKLEPDILERFDAILEELGVDNRSVVLRLLVTMFTAMYERLRSGTPPLDLAKYAAADIAKQLNLHKKDAYGVFAATIAAVSLELFGIVAGIVDDFIAIKDELEKLVYEEEAEREAKTLLDYQAPILSYVDNYDDGDGLGEAAMA